MDIEFICLANSVKEQGRCVADLRMDNKGWIRPVSEAPGGTLFRPTYVLDNGEQAALLDVIRVSVSSPRTEPHQPENWVLENKQWRILGRLPPTEAWERLRRFLVSGPNLLGGRTDRLDYAAIQQNPVRASLALIEPSQVSWVITTSTRGNRQTRARFSLAGASYDLSITDPKWRQRLSDLPLGTHPRTSAGISSKERLLFNTSLGGPFIGECYKLVAAVILL